MVEKDYTEKLKKIGPPQLDPDEWTATKKVQFNTNCYAYACNDSFCDYKPGTYLPQPGVAAGDKIFMVPQADKMQEAAIRDGLELAGTSAFEKPPAKEGHYLAALYVYPGNEYHWYRQDQDGTWSHKTNGQAPKNTDDSGKVIKDLMMAYKGRLKDFGGYFYVPNGGLEVGLHAKGKSYEERLIGLQKEEKPKLNLRDRAIDKCKLSPMKCQLSEPVKNPKSLKVDRELLAQQKAKMR